MHCKTHGGFDVRRRGAAVVELAIVLPVFVLLIIGAIDIGRAIMVRHKLVEAARAACRLHAVKDVVTPKDVEDVIEMVMEDAELTKFKYTLDPPNAKDLKQLGPVTASISVAYDDVSWLPTSWFLSGETITATCVMPGDTGDLTSTVEGGGGGGTPTPPPPDDDDDDDDKKKAKSLLRKLLQLLGS
jgi:hypothetical protein